MKKLLIILFLFSTVSYGQQRLNFDRILTEMTDSIEMDSSAFKINIWAQEMWDSLEVKFSVYNYLKENTIISFDNSSWGYATLTVNTFDENGGQCYTWEDYGIINYFTKKCKRRQLKVLRELIAIKRLPYSLVRGHATDTPCGFMLILKKYKPVSISYYDDTYLDKWKSID